ncbi:hypothetical protein [Paraburkholderia azotifigens]|uniref:Uncharacterized protein n=1 Tax=Paraburkholderia azotifigens TaxID=2057004 RepID=A0A5C6VGM5_9BURK|nr:hypothetical protein [Paraburkholderia azotifigens]TXC84493.1 hypothetical protein FRZ40_29930 [Paraburkholderia azotifigens]
MDDTPDKLRRNVVVLAAAILAIAFFNLSFRPTGTLLGFAEVGQVSPFNVWLALAIVLCYLFLRYRFANETLDEWFQIVDEFKRIRYQVVTQQVATAVRRYFLHGQRVPWFQDFDAFIDGEIVTRMQRDGNARRIRSLTASPENEANQSWWQGRAGITFEVEWTSGVYGRSGGHMPGFSFPARVRARVILLCIVRAAVSSRVGVDVAVPYTLSALAMLVCLFKLAFFFPV